jgi:predicted transcriptional regulator
MASRKILHQNPSAGASEGKLMGHELSNAIVFFHQAVAAHLGMNAAEWKCLGLLSQHGPSTASRLAELSGFTTGAITGIVDRLEQAGYARREPNPADRRSVIVQPLHLKDMQQRISPIFQSLSSAMATVTSRYTAGELKAIGSFFAETIEVLRVQTSKLKQKHTAVDE